ncbi:MAG: hypothetical protein SGI73_13435, partial [Chloroflexota bacterium]|nr:hypothetical protein [Chloroflexota bacterium]
MDNTRLNQIVCEAVKLYADGGRGANIRLYFLRDEEQHVYAVNAVDDPMQSSYEFEESPSGVVVIARVEGETVIIEDDATDKPLIDALLQRGV